MSEAKKDVLFAYVSPDNKKFVDDTAKQYNEKLSNIVDKIIEGFRTGKKVKFDTVVPKFVEKAEAWKKKHA